MSPIFLFLWITGICRAKKSRENRFREQGPLLSPYSCPGITPPKLPVFFVAVYHGTIIERAYRQQGKDCGAGAAR